MRSCSACNRSRIAVASACALITSPMISVSVGINASTSRGEKYPSATEPSLHKDRMDLLRPVHPPRERQLDVRGPARPGDEIDHAPAPSLRRTVVPSLEEHPH